MTRDEILSMKPGRELDALVAEKVMGQRFRSEWHKLHNDTIACYSTDIAAALEVAIHLQKQGYYVCIELKACEETSVGVYEENPVEQIAYAKAQTPAEAICKAALLAVMEKEDSQ